MLQPLTWFGLLERDGPADPLGSEAAKLRFRRTALFDRFIAFCPPPPFVQAS
jgi:hypothetical protein